MADDIIESSRALVETAHALRVDFLRVEIKIANAMLDTSKTTRDEATRERRLGRAREACAEVSRWLDATLPSGRMTDAEHDELTLGLAQARARLAMPG